MRRHGFLSQVPEQTGIIVPQKASNGLVLLRYVGFEGLWHIEISIQGKIATRSYLMFWKSSEPRNARWTGEVDDF